MLDEFELELLDEFELELDELFEEELELELLEEFELEFDELFEDEFELELDELLPATMMAPSLLLVMWGRGRSTSGDVAAYSRACAPVAASAVMPATAEASFQYRFIAVTPFPGRTGCSGPQEERASCGSIPCGGRMGAAGCPS